MLGKFQLHLDLQKLLYRHHDLIVERFFMRAREVGEVNRHLFGVLTVVGVGATPEPGGDPFEPEIEQQRVEEPKHSFVS